MNAGAKLKLKFRVHFIAHEDKHKIDLLKS